MNRAQRQFAPLQPAPMPVMRRSVVAKPALRSVKSQAPASSLAPRPIPAPSAASRAIATPALPQPVSALPAPSRPTPAPVAPTVEPVAPHRPIGPGRGLETATRAAMEQRFGTDLGRVRIHDSPSAAAMASGLRARAYSVGRDIVFGAAQYQPDSAPGQALLAHELAHVLQARDSGMAPVQGHAVPTLEFEAAAALAAISAGKRPEIRARAPAGQPLCAPDDQPAPTATPASQPAAPASIGTSAPPDQRLPPNLRVELDEPAGLGTSKLVVTLDTFTLPAVKGMGKWVQEAYDQAAGGRLVFTPIITAGDVSTPDSIAAFKEADEDYKSKWLRKYGFTSTQKLAAGFRTAAATNEKVKTALADKDVSTLVNGLAYGLQAAKCDIDHIVEKQVGGTSIPTNLQLLQSDKNQTSGRKTYEALSGFVKQVRDPLFRGPGVLKMQIRIGKIVVPPDASDPSMVVEQLLRDGDVVGTEHAKIKAGTNPVSLTAGGMTETVNIMDTGTSTIETTGRRLVPGAKLKKYIRGPGSTSRSRDMIEGVLDNDVIQELPGKRKPIRFIATRVAAPAAPQPDADAATATEPTPAPVGELRQLKLAPGVNEAIPFYYPYLSPGSLGKLELAADGALSGKGTIASSIPFLGTLNILYTKESIDLVAPVPADKLKSPFPSAFRFTSGELKLALSPRLVPSGSVNFEVGPRGKPLLEGDLSAKLQGGVAEARGKIRPVGKLPGLDATEGEVSWTSEAGWAGSLKATSTIKNAQGSAELGFKKQGDGLAPYGTGMVVTPILGSQLELHARYNGLYISYWGAVTVKDPVPGVVRSIKLTGSYSDKWGIGLEGSTKVEWRGLSGEANLKYQRGPEDDEGKISGSAGLAYTSPEKLGGKPKVEGSVALTFANGQMTSAVGKFAYGLTKDIRPELEVSFDRKRRLKLTGTLTLAPITLADRWPGGKKGEREIVSGGIEIPLLAGTGVPPSVASVFIRVSGGIGVSYGVGPLVLGGISLTASALPLEENPEIEATITARLGAPASFKLYGRLGLELGASILSGYGGRATGGVEVVPALALGLDAGVDASGKYKQGEGFSFMAVAAVSGQAVFTTDINLVARIEILKGYLYDKSWKKTIGHYQFELGPKITVTLGTLSYDRNGISWPSLSGITVSPDSFDPRKAVRNLFS